jgi:hypothetical protein
MMNLKTAAEIRDILEWTCVDCGGDLRQIGYHDVDFGTAEWPAIQHLCNVCEPVDDQFSTDMADALVQQSSYADDVDDYEYNQYGHVYTLVDGSSLIVSNASIVHIPSSRYHGVPRTA